MTRRKEVWRLDLQTGEVSMRRLSKIRYRRKSQPVRPPRYVETEAPADVRAADRRIEELYEVAQSQVTEVRASLVGRFVKRRGIVYQITRAGVGLGGKHINLWGVRAGGIQPGTKVFDIGYAILCTFLERRD